MVLKKVVTLNRLKFRVCVFWEECTFVERGLLCLDLKHRSAQTRQIDVNSLICEQHQQYYRWCNVFKQQVKLTITPLFPPRLWSSPCPSLHTTLPNPPLGFFFLQRKSSEAEFIRLRSKGGGMEKKRSQRGQAEERLHIQAWTPGQTHRSTDFQHWQLPFKHRNITDRSGLCSFYWSRNENEPKFWTRKCTRHL